MAPAKGGEPDLRIVGAVEALDRIYPWLDETAGGEIPETLLSRMHVVLEEAVANVALHGFAPDAPGHITLRLRVEKGQVRLIIEDDGAPFDPTTAEIRPMATSLAEVIPGGWGLGLIRKFCPAATYERRNGLNYLTLPFPMPV